MDELRQALMLMHAGTHAPASVEPGEVDRLVARYREAGMRIDPDVARDLDDVSTAPRLVQYDVLRETLTNVAKHPPIPEVTVRIDGDLETITVRIENKLGPATPHADASLGLTGPEHRVGRQRRYLPRPP